MESKYVIERTDLVNFRVEYLSLNKKVWIPKGKHTIALPRYGAWEWGIASNLSSGLRNAQESTGRYSFVCRPARGVDLRPKQKAALLDALNHGVLTQKDSYCLYEPGGHHHNTIVSLIKHGYFKKMDRPPKDQRDYFQKVEPTERALQGIPVCN